MDKGHLKNGEGTVRMTYVFENFRKERTTRESKSFFVVTMMVDTEQNRRVRRSPGTKPCQLRLETIGYDEGR